LCVGPFCTNMCLFRLSVMARDTHKNAKKKKQKGRQRTSSNSQVMPPNSNPLSRRDNPIKPKLE